MKCTVCGADLCEGQSYCSYCGTKVEEQEEQTLKQPPVQTEEQPMEPSAIQEISQGEETVPPAVDQTIFAEEPSTEFNTFDHPSSPAPAETEAADKSALLGMILGIISFVLCCIGLPTGIIGIVNSAKGLRSKNRKAMAIVGLIFSIISVVLFLNIWSSILIEFFGIYFNFDQSTPSGGIDLSVFSELFR